MLLDLPFLNAIEIYISAYLADDAMNLDGSPKKTGLSLKIQADSQEPEFHRLFNKSSCCYVLIQPEPGAPLDDEDQLEHDAFFLTIVEVYPEEEIELMLTIRDRAYDSL